MVPSANWKEAQAWVAQWNLPSDLDLLSVLWYLPCLEGATEFSVDGDGLA